ncbi:glucose/sorbosone family PQQ-dependent dehydrogenase [Kitasatospora sp. NPDC057500]|uniref:glucose/sorbosone family PQQ-dependent dehydrogenase n=1 Tax=Kitasatospora sp. NPDC057500 TaxID=3346151 RepID=UPI0036995841
MKYRYPALAAASALVLGVTLATSVPATAGGPTGPSGSASSPEFDRSVLTTGLGDPYELLWGPDGQLWSTEKSGLKVTRIDPETGEKVTALDLTAVAHHTEGGQDGVLGLAFQQTDTGWGDGDHRGGGGHDDGEAYVYVSYTYMTDTPAEVTGETRRLKIVRYTLDCDDHTLHSPEEILTGLPSGTDHQSARLRIGEDGKLYYTVGDQGANQLAHFCNPNWAQRLPTQGEVDQHAWFGPYQGKILRINPDGSVPDDNPAINGVRSHIISYGHRNSQGLDFAPDGTLYQTDQGPKTDDEVNVITPGNNYGWPYVAGWRDDMAYTYANWAASAPTPCTDLTYDDIDIPPSVPQQKETDWNGAFVPPISTLGTTVPTGFEFRDPKCAEGGLYFICYPTVAPSSLTYYAKDGVRGWKNSLLITTLKDGSVYRLKVGADGNAVGDAERLWTTQNRYRATALSPDGRTVYVATDSAGLVRDVNTGAPTTALENPGAILAFSLQR